MGDPLEVAQLLQSGQLFAGGVAMDSAGRSEGGLTDWGVTRFLPNGGFDDQQGLDEVFQALEFGEGEASHQPTSFYLQIYRGPSFHSGRQI